MFEWSCCQLLQKEQYNALLGTPSTTTLSSPQIIHDYYQDEEMLMENPIIKHALIYDFLEFGIYDLGYSFTILNPKGKT